MCELGGGDFQGLLAELQDFSSLCGFRGLCVELLGNFLERVFLEGGQGSGAGARKAMAHPPDRDLVAALLHFVSQRASFASFGCGTRSCAWSRSWQSSDRCPFSASLSLMEMVERWEWCSAGASCDPGSGLAA